MKNRKTTSLILVANKQEAQVALNYKKSQPHENIKLVSADLSSIQFFNNKGIKHQPVFNLINRLDQKLKPNLIPIQIAIKFLNSPSVRNQLQLANIDLTKPLKEMLNFKLTYSLQYAHILSQLKGKLKFNKLIISNELIPTEILKFFTKSHQVKVINLNTWETPLKLLQKRINKKIYTLEKLTKEILTLLLHSQISLKSWFNPPRRSLKPSLSSTDKSVLVFSNGLNLVSYHSAIKQLSQKINTHVLTGKQQPLDRYYITRYQLETTELLDLPLSVIKYSERLSGKLSQLTLKLKLHIPKNFKLDYGLPIKRQIIKDIFINDTYYVLKNWMNKFLQYYAKAKYAINYLKPSLVIVTHDPGPSGLAFSLAAQEKGITTVVFLHGSPSQNHFFFSDKEIIWGPLMKQYLVKYGGKPKRFILGGYPIYYDYLKYFKKHQTRRGKKLKIGILASGFGVNEINQTEAFTKLLSQLIHLTSKAQIAVRTHPTQRLDGLKSYANNLGFKITVNPPVFLEEFVAQQDLIITQDSSAAITPLIAGKPTIMYPAEYPLVDRGFVRASPAFFRPKTNENLAELINRIINNKSLLKSNRQEQKRYLKRYCHLIDSKTGERIANKLIKLLR